MSRRKRSDQLSGGHDSFLDIVANLVGILIILVVILGARSHQLAQEIEIEPPTEAELALIDREHRTALSVSRDVERLEKSISAYDGELEHRRKEREVLMQLLDVAQQQWEESLAEMDEQKQKTAALQRDREIAENELAELNAQASALEEVPESIVAVEHLPTPMAKTVFGDEVHFRLKDGLLAMVPVDALLDEIKEDFQRLASSARSGDKESSVGPIRDFVAHYSMQMSRESVARGGQIGMASRVQVAELIIEPLREPIGEPIAQALQPQSQLAYELAGRDPASTTVTVWVYPESFAQFRQVKEYLYRMGFATAGRPLPHGHPIAGSPSGSRSQSQ
ncbi:hypothetical protein [Rosistilla oblonga]|uniref:Uncharacterized protein n=1 Tax=Rosistilla oblonga TaxID=2527990 RepID=A0A518IUC7_9BACT|nr:hypothetical protein [Rosistilla oblonga]QDV56678.1 hypothetical protein Mal33_26760 [Rosistilla oblonga]